MGSSRILIANAHPGGNLGAEAMLSVLVNHLKSWPEVIDRYDIWFETISSSSAYSRFVERHGVPANFFRFKPRRFGDPYDIEARSGDVLIDIGGIAYPDVAGIGNLRNFRRHRYFASRGTKAIFFTQDFGPTDRVVTRLLAKAAIGGADAVFARSERSKAYLSAIVPSVPILGPYPDCTIALEPAPMPSNSLGGSYFVVVPSAIMWNKYGERYLEFILELIHSVPDCLDVLLLVHNFTPNGGTSDSAVCDLIAGRLSGVRKVEIYRQNASPNELKGVLMRATAVITSRYHALVGALSSGTPAFALGWNHKYTEFLKLYGVRDWSLDLLNLPGAKTDRRILASKIISKLLSGEGEEILGAVNRDLKQQVGSSFQRLRGLLSD